MQYFDTEHPSNRDSKLDTYHGVAIERKSPREDMWSFGKGVTASAELADEIDKEEENN